MGSPAASLDLVIRMIAEGRGAELSREQVAALITEIRKLESEIKKIEGAGGAVSANTDARLDQLKQTLTALGPAELNKAGEGLAEEAAKGFANKFPMAVQQHIGTVIGQLIGVVGLGRAFASGGAAGIGMAGGLALVESIINKLHEYFAAIDEMEQRVRNFENVTDSLDPMRAIRQSIANDRAAFNRAFAEIEASVWNVNKAFAAQNQLMREGQKILQEVDDKELERQKATIKAKGAAGTITSFDESRQIEAAERAARVRKEEQTIQNLEAEEALKRKQAKANLFIATTEKLFAEDVDAPMVQQQRQVDKAKAIEKLTGESNEKKIKDLREQQGFLKRIEGSGLSGTDTWRANTMDATDSATGSFSPLKFAISDSSKDGRANPEFLKRKNEEIASAIEALLNETAEAAQVTRIQQGRLAPLTEARAKHQERATENETAREQAEKDADLVHARWVLALKRRADLAEKQAQIDEQNLRSAQSENARKQAIIDKQADIKFLESDLANTKPGDPGRAAIIEAIAVLKSDLEKLQQFRPEYNRLNKATEEKNLDEAGRTNRQEQQKAFEEENRRRGGKGFSAIDASPIGAAAEALADFGDKFQDGTKRLTRSVATVKSQLDGALKSIADLEARLDAGRA